ncbi:hypothetical protein KI387_003389, partial [Taxus chinensis]
MSQTVATSTNFDLFQSASTNYNTCSSEGLAFSTSSHQNPLNWGGTTTEFMMAQPTNGNTNSFFPGLRRSETFLPQPCFTQQGYGEQVHTNTTQQHQTPEFWKPTWSSQALMKDNEEVTMRRDFNFPFSGSFTDHPKSSADVQPLNALHGQYFSAAGDGHTSEPSEKRQSEENNETQNVKDNSTKPRSKAEKKIRRPRYAFQTRSQVDILDDGYRWRKYGQKSVKNNVYP